MTDIWDKLIDLLNQTLEIYQALLELSKKKRAVLANAKPQELEMLTKQEEVLILEAGKLENLRLKHMGELTATLGLPEEKRTLAALITCADEETADELKAISEEFAEVNEELQELNEINAKLIQQSLEFINYSINILSRSTVGPTYAAKGDTTPAGASSRSILDTKA